MANGAARTTTQVAYAGADFIFVFPSSTIESLMFSNFSPTFSPMFLSHPALESMASAMSISMAMTKLVRFVV